jgi:hypothetical protein
MKGEVVSFERFLRFEISKVQGPSERGLDCPFIPRITKVPIPTNMEVRSIYTSSRVGVADAPGNHFQFSSRATCSRSHARKMSKTSKLVT